MGEARMRGTLAERKAAPNGRDTVTEDKLNKWLNKRWRLKRRRVRELWGSERKLDSHKPTDGK